jgi:Fe-S oxidoreductase
MLSRYPIGLAAAVVALGVAGVRLTRLASLVLAGAPLRRRPGLRELVATELGEVLAQRKLLRWALPGLAHAFTFWGFIVLLLTVIEAFGDLFSEKFAIPGIGHNPAVGFLEDFFACAVLVAVIVFASLRQKESPRRTERRSRFFGSHTGAAWAVLCAIAAVMVSLLLYRAAEANTGDFPYSWWAFASRSLGWALHPLGYGANKDLETAFVDLNIVVIAAFLVFVVHSKHLHIFLAPLNVALARRPRALGALATTPDLSPAALSEETRFGAGKVEELNRKQLLDLLTCTECGRCQSQCPAWATGKPLSPKLLVMDLRDELLSSSPRHFGRAHAGDAGLGRQSLVPSVIGQDVLWSCTTCGACVEQCPVDIEHVDTILDIRRHQVMAESDFPPEAATMLRNIESRGDPWGMGAAKRLEWAQSLACQVPVANGRLPEGAEYLFWVGCAGAFDDRAKRTTQALARLLDRAGVGFAVLGREESCTGDPARRLGNEYLYQEQARKNIKTLRSVGATKVLTSCPHCFNTLLNEYPALGGSFQVLHHSQLLALLSRSGRLQPGQLKALVTYHDPCYLGRHNRVFDEPRMAVASVPGLGSVEMRRCRERSFCCGAGGARMWMEERLGTRINIERANEALSTGAEVVGTACPYCLIMLDDAVKALGRQGDLEVLDIAQLLERSLAQDEKLGSEKLGSEK